MPNTTSLLSSIDENFQIKVYGKRVEDFSISTEYQSRLTPEGIKPIFVQIYGAKVMGDCIKFPKPFISILPDNGTAPDGCGDLGDAEKYLMWVLVKGQPFAVLSMETGSVEDMLKQDLTPFIDVDADFHFHDVRVEGTVLKGVLRAKLNLHQKIFGHNYNFNIVDGDYPFSYNIADGVCYPLYTVGVASAEVCIYSNPNRVCGSIAFTIDLPSPVPDFNKTFDIACVTF